MFCVESQDMCFVQSQYKVNHRVGWPKATTFVLVLGKAHVLALNIAQASRLNKADVLALNEAHVPHLNPKICPVLTGNIKETTKEGRPKAASFVLAVNTVHILMLRRCSVEAQDLRFVES